MHKLQDCIDKKCINLSRSREVIYRILLDSNECMGVTQIIHSASELYPKKISLNTIYRHLKLF
jgi:Fe2+ or Zn2+ uptake regulation protein